MTQISIVIPTYNRLSQLKQVLAGFEAQTWDMSEVEIIVVSDGSTDGTDSFLLEPESTLNLVAGQQQNAGPAAARNLGVTLASGELIIFVDDDVVPGPNLIAEHVKSHDKEGEKCVVLGPMLSPEDFRMSSWVHWEQMMLYKQYADMEAGRWEPTARQFYTGNASLNRQHFIEAGGFDVSFRRAEDVELAYRLADNGLRFAFNPQAIGYHYVSRKFSSWIETPYMYGRNDVIFTRDKGQSWLIPKVLEEFQSRHPIIRTLTWLCLSRPWASKLAISGLKQIADLGSRLKGLLPKSAALPRFAYSGIYNLTYYQGFADELGDRKRFFNMLSERVSNQYILNKQESGAN